MFRSALLRGLAFALGIATTAMVLVIVWQAGLFEGEETSDLGPVAQVGEVTHIRARIKTVEADGSNGVRFEETWADTTGAFVRTEQRNGDGEAIRIAVRRVNDLRELDLSEEGAPHSKSESYPDVENTWLATEAGGALWWRDFFRGPSVETLGQTEMNGREAILVRVPPPESGENPRPIEATVDKETGLPLEIRFFQRAAGGGFEFIGKWAIKYELAESLPIESISYLFDVGSVDRDAASYKRMSLADAQAFAAFPLFYLGDSFDGMALESITVSSPLGAPSTQQVLLIYAEWAGEPPVRLVRELDVVITPEIAPARTGPGAQFNPQLGQEVITTAKGEALFDPDDNRLDLPTEGVQVVIQGDKTTSDQILEAAEALTALNAGAVRPSAPTP